MLMEKTNDLIKYCHGAEVSDYQNNDGMYNTFDWTCFQQLPLRRSSV